MDNYNKRMQPFSFNATLNLVLLPIQIQVLKYNNRFQMQVSSHKISVDFANVNYTSSSRQQLNNMRKHGCKSKMQNPELIVSFHSTMLENISFSSYFAMDSAKITIIDSQNG